MPAKTNKTPFNPSLGFYPTRSGNGFSVLVSASVYDTLQKATIGSRLFLKEIPEERRQKMKGNNKPAMEVIILPKSDGAAAGAAESDV